MEALHWTLAGHEVCTYRTRTLVIGSGCAGLNAADWLHDLGERDVMLMTEDMNTGTSRNAGSDKQTYYKLSVSASAPDSVAKMARSLQADGVHGDIAYTEAACSAQSFFKLVQLGVQFPKNAYGEFVGYQTDHDQHARASSAGPLTSRHMTEALQRQIESKGIPILDRSMAFKLLIHEGRVAGALALDLDRLQVLMVFCAHVILCTGGPAALYRDSVYPPGQTGMSGIALEAGAAAANLHQWQYGIASLSPRWNLSGSYQQALPRYVSVDDQGRDREFLLDAFDNPNEAARLCFLKGYQWPFDVSKVPGSSLIDLLIHRERCELNRRVYLDYTRNPSPLNAGLSTLDEVALNYLSRCGALQDTPYERLAAINPPACELFRARGVDLAQTPLEIGVCAQHHNGGIGVDCHWQSSVPGLYVAGEAAGTFGAYRPGGSALNSGQVGSMRAAEHIAWHSTAQAPEAQPYDWLVRALETPLECLALNGDPSITASHWQQRMSEHAAHLRDEREMLRLLDDAERRQSVHNDPLPSRLPPDIAQRLKLRDQHITMRATLSAMLYAAEHMGSTGAGLVRVQNAPLTGSMKPTIPQTSNTLVATRRASAHFLSSSEPVRPMPQAEQWFERAWAEYREERENQSMKTR